MIWFDHWRPNRLWVVGLFSLYLLFCSLLPNHFMFPLLILSMVIAAQTWEVPGGALAAIAAFPAMLFGLYRLLGADFLAHTEVLWGYLWTWLAVAGVAIVVGSLTRQGRYLVQVNQDLRQAQRRLAALHQIALNLSRTLDSDKLMDMILEQLNQLWGYSAGAILLLEEESGDLVIAAGRGYVSGTEYRIPRGKGICGEVVRTGMPIYVGDVTKDSRYVPGVAGARSELAVPLIWEGKVIGVLNVESTEPYAYGAADVTLLCTVAEQAAAYLRNAHLHQRTHNMAITDAHTGLYNYRHYQEQVEAMVRDAQLSGRPFSLLMIDVDHFKRVNDTYGHPTGDAVLAQVATVLQESCRQADMVFRYGGEEFAVILPDAAPETAVMVAERIRERSQSHSFTTRTGRSLEFSLTVSIGIASYPQDGLGAVDLLLAADKAVYAAKSAGRNQVLAHEQVALAQHPPLS